MKFLVPSIQVKRNVFGDYLCFDHLYFIFSYANNWQSRVSQNPNQLETSFSSQSMYFADGVAILIIFLIICLLCSKSFIFLKIFRRHAADTEKLQPSSSSNLKTRHSWGRLYKFLLILCLLFVCTYFIYLRFFGCNDLFDVQCLGALSHKNDCTLQCVNKLPVIGDHCTGVGNFQVEVIRCLKNNFYFNLANIRMSTFDFALSVCI